MGVTAATIFSSKGQRSRSPDVKNIMWLTTCTTKMKQCVQLQAVYMTIL